LQAGNNEVQLMALLLSEADVKQILTMAIALAAVEDSFRRLADGSALLHSRQRLRLPGKSYLHYMAAADATSGYMGMKIYTSSPAGLRFLVPLFHVGSGELLALIEADYLGQIRTGAASGVATGLLARADAAKIGIIGTGLQSRTQLQALSLVRTITGVHAFSRNPEHRERFAREMTAQLGVPVVAVASAQEAVRGADIVVTSTTSTNPVLDGSWLAPGMHVNAIGANFPQKHELDGEAIRRCDIIVADSREQSKIEAGDLIQMYGDDKRRWASVTELAEIVAGKTPGRSSPEQITLFKSNGIATEDVVVAGRIYELARERGLGRQVPLWEKDAREGVARGV
jgi:ornithine cyclodeaminase/alanine dehydrogenase-like protein (mu-crystallin family)